MSQSIQKKKIKEQPYNLGKKKRAGKKNIGDRNL